MIVILGVLGVGCGLFALGMMTVGFLTDGLAALNYRRRQREHRAAVEFHAEHPAWARQAETARYFESFFTPNYSARGL